ncbi:TetR/AcrR family transcriptional regulator [Corynebacterium sp. TAE3-ERU12]|uniref:TetR/AcrR family transcriptional regulator n=1 Tax=Corynebacterium sp. TAE3-ERU12 TaxID=2849491 RepID=UPI001C44610E|nr:TetR/AcrR family transcriptional regulator [Corynebacterium sp. TAE3-ERU12]MBV7294871.1 TetR/AcrR family transcriptional regulator [Corynebacterium sp. TAE3-ERU12]
MTDAATTREHAAQKRRAAILDAARRVYIRDGYHDARLTDIAAEAGCSVGTLYTHFAGREALLAAVLRSVENDMRRPAAAAVRNASPGAELAATNRSYLESYRRNAEIMALLEQVSQARSDIRDIRIQRAQDFVARNAAWLEKLREAGEIDAGIDTEMMSAALSSMTSRLAYATWVEGVFDNSDATFERVLATVNRVWWAALGVHPGWGLPKNGDMNPDSV